MIIEGDCISGLKKLQPRSVQCVVTSPPYYLLRDYGVEGQLGLEPSPEEYVANLVEVFRGVREALRDDGTLWINLGDSYAATTKGSGGHSPKQDSNAGSWHEMRVWQIPSGLKPKDLIGIPWRVAFALQADGWWLRSDIIWSKPAPMPESVTDRPTKAHEYLFLLAKSERYYYDAEAIAEPFADERMGNPGGGGHYVREAYAGAVARHNAQGGLARGIWNEDRSKSKRNRRSVWTIASEPCAEAHFAVMPQALVEPCILAGTPAAGCCERCGAPREHVIKLESRPNRRTVSRDAKVQPEDSPFGVNRSSVGKDLREKADLGWRDGCSCGAAASKPALVMDPFAGAGTVGLVAAKLGRDFVGFELNPKYKEIADRRIFWRGAKIRR